MIDHTGVTVSNFDLSTRRSRMTRALRRCTLAFAFVVLAVPAWADDLQVAVAANFSAAAQKIATALTRMPPRRATKPTKGSKVRRVDEKKARGRVKQQRRTPVED